MAENNLKILSDICKNDISKLQTLQENDNSFHWSSLALPKTRETCLHLAAQYGHHDAILYLLTKFNPKVVDVRNCDNKTPLHEAAQYGHYNCVKILVDNGADVNAIKRSDWTPLMLACTKISEDYVRIAEYLLGRGSLVNFKNKDGWTCLHLAARNSNSSFLKLLLNTKNIDSTLRTKNGRCALHIAALHGNLENIKLLISLIDVNCTDSSGNIPFHEGVLSVNLEIIDYLASRGANISAVNKTGSNALHLAAGQGLGQVIRHLICEYKFDVNLTNSNGFTPLHCAARKKNYEAMKILRELGAKVDILDKFGRMAQDYS